MLSSIPTVPPGAGRGLGAVESLTLSLYSAVQNKRGWFFMAVVVLAGGDVAVSVGAHPQLHPFPPRVPLAAALLLLLLQHIYWQRWHRCWHRWTDGHQGHRHSSAEGMDQAQARQDSDGAQATAWGAGAKARPEVPHGGCPFLPGQTGSLGTGRGRIPPPQELWCSREQKIQGAPVLHRPGRVSVPPRTPHWSHCPTPGLHSTGVGGGGMESQALPCSGTRSWGQGHVWPSVAAEGGLRFGGPGSGDTLLSPPGAAPPAPCTRQSQTCSGAGQ